MTLDELQDPAAIAALDGPPTTSPLTATSVALHDPDLHLALSVGGTSCDARCSLWWSDTPAYDDHDVGLVGHYGAADEATADALLSHALERLRAASCTIAVGPMDGATWFPYRFVTDGTDRAPFFLEPSHPATYPEHFGAQGFRPLTEYVSASVPSLDEAPPGDPPVEVRVRPLDVDDVQSELSRLYTLVTAAFRGNVLYTPIEESRFIQLYQRLVPALTPSLVRLAETPDGQLVGLAFLVPDQRQAERNEQIDTVVVKTLAVHPDVAGRGLGSWLLTDAQYRAREHGYRAGIHALMHERNRSRRISQHYGDVFRRYTLFAHEL